MGIMATIDASADSVPTAVLSCVSDFIGDSFMFYRGPFTVEKTCSELAYSRDYKRDAVIDVIYDPRNPPNVQRHDSEEHTKCRLKWLCAVLWLLVVSAGVVYGFLYTMEAIGYGHILEVLLIVVSVSLCFSFVVALFLCRKNGVGCFTRAIDSEIKVRIRSRKKQLQTVHEVETPGSVEGLLWS